MTAMAIHITIYPDERIAAALDAFMLEHHWSATTVIELLLTEHARLPSAPPLTRAEPATLTEELARRASCDPGVRMADTDMRFRKDEPMNHIIEVTRKPSRGATDSNWSAWQSECSCGWDGGLHDRKTLADTDGALHAIEDLSGVIDGWLYPILRYLPDRNPLSARLRELIPSTSQTSGDRVREYERRDAILAWMWDCLSLITTRVPEPIRTHWIAMLETRSSAQVAALAARMIEYDDEALTAAERDRADYFWCDLERAVEDVGTALLVVARDESVTAEATAMLAHASAELAWESATSAQDEEAEAWRAIDAEIAEGGSATIRRCRWTDEVEDDAVRTLVAAQEAEGTARRLRREITTGAEYVAALATEAVCLVAPTSADETIFWTVADPVALLRRLTA